MMKKEASKPSETIERKSERTKRLILRLAKACATVFKHNRHFGPQPKEVHMFILPQLGHLAAILYSCPLRLWLVGLGQDEFRRIREGKKRTDAGTR